MSSREKNKFIIDCDTGVDDAVSILMALQSEAVDLLAITCVNGNCTVDRAVNNTLVTLNVAKQQVPVYRGCSKPLTAFGPVSTFVHGSDGLGGVAKEYTACSHSLQPAHAVNTLVDLVNKHPGEITLVTLGPLTNIAVAYRLDEKFSSKLKRLVIMGGNTEGKGNDKRMCSEFNFAVDPEAAQIVVEETVCDCQICGWELCGLNSGISWDWYDSWVSNSSHEVMKFVKSITEGFYKKLGVRERFPERGFALCDPLAMSVAIDPDIVCKSERKRATVETAGHYSRGMLVIDWKEGVFPRDTKPLELVVQIDKEKHKNYLEEIQKLQ